MKYTSRGWDMCNYLQPLGMSPTSVAKKRDVLTCSNTISSSPPIQAGPACRSLEAGL